MLDPSGLWVLTVTSGKVSTRTSSGDSWDAFGGAPDPFVCLTIGTRRTCTSTQQDTFQPSWNEQFPAATATAFLSGVTVSLVDEDVSSNDPICGPDVVPVTEASFLLGAWNPTCTNGDFRATLTAQ
jgi:Ca2+-dependent lipid-binding protein